MDFDSIEDEPKTIIEVYYQGKLDGKAYEKTNKYIKAHEKSVFDSLSKQIDFVTIDYYALANKKTASLKELTDETMNELVFTFDISEEDKQRIKKRKQELQERAKNMKVGKEWGMVKQVLKSIVVIGDKIVWLEPPFPNMECKIIQLKDMYYKYPPDVDHGYDEGYRFTEEQLSMIMDWLKKGKWSAYEGSASNDEKWRIIRETLKAYFIITDSTDSMKTIWIEPPFSNMLCRTIGLNKMHYVFPPNSDQAIQGYSEGYRFTEEQLDMLMKWLKIGKENEHKKGFVMMF